jgi:hypothetical protein
LYDSGTVTKRPKAAQPKYLSGAGVWLELPELGKLDRALFGEVLRGLLNWLRGLH